jgi:hypothetical protein
VSHRARIPLSLVAMGLLSACATPTVPTLPPPSPALSDAELDERIDFIAKRLDASRLHGQLWNYGWIAAETGGLITGIIAAANADNGNDRAAGIVTSVLSVGGYVYQYVMPMRVRHGSDPFRDLPEATHEEKVRKLAKAQEVLADDAQRATVQIDWEAHAANAAVSALAAGVVIAAGDDHRAGPTLFTGLSALIGGEAQFWTEPAAPRRDIQDYVDKFVEPGAPHSRVHLGPGAGGVALRIDF